MKREGLILINKPKGITSHDVVDVIRKKFSIRKVGHAGTLDPQATGLLPILVGRYTKLFPQFVNFDKEYIGIMKLGEVTTTGDSEGEMISRSPWEHLGEDEIRDAFSKFHGEIEQIPPMVSALRVNGKRLYKLARRGIEVERKPRKINIYQLEIQRIDRPFIEFYVKCSKGTYIRKLAEDIGAELKCGAHVVSITRTAIGPFRLADAVGLEECGDAHLTAYTFK
ncbi:MAG: tRNA pseudouridine(55) synthase TruB [Candidatus Omnitrophica bacterium]|nr:tRNA pseudouridine(55) synthase TruB [Candidatus Omnitrophota bacterium]